MKVKNKGLTPGWACRLAVRMQFHHSDSPMLSDKELNLHSLFLLEKHCVPVISDILLHNFSSLHGVMQCAPICPLLSAGPLCIEAMLQTSEPTKMNYCF